jgi:type IV pilus assembly protein PilY1
MELMMDNCNPDTGLYPDGSGGGNCGGKAPTCDGHTATSQNRWATEVTALTGSFANNAYACFSEPRTAGSAFDTEYSLQYASGATAQPYDLNYFINYHRPVQPLTATTACAYGFNQTTTGWYPDLSAQHQENPAAPATADFALAQIQGYVYDTTTMLPTTTPPTVCPGGFQQNSDGLISIAQNAIRFGMFTFDSDPLPNTGVAQPVADSQTTFNLTFNDVANSSPSNTITTGLWSYYNGWETATAPNWAGASVGRPAGCGETGVPLIGYEVGARNPAAPPWEGRMMRFPPGANTAPAANNQNIMQAIRAMRPYGANPIAGMMDDAKYYFWQDPEGPVNDPLVQCRPQFIILLSHAAPNEDLQPYCQGGTSPTVGMCPYDYPEYIAQGLAAGSYSPGTGVVNAQSALGSGRPVKTFVVGFSASTNLGAGKNESCQQILLGTYPNYTVDPTKCGVESLNGGGDAGTNGDPTYASCCALARIAVSGGTTAPYFADNQTDLNSALQAILAVIVANASTRATPVLLPQQTGSTNESAAVFLSSFTPSPIVAWSGNEQRQRYQCTSSGTTWGAQQQPITPTAGDDFQYNLEQTQGAPRNVILAEPYLLPATYSPQRVSSGNIRPWANGPGAPLATGVGFDGYTLYDSTEYGYSYTPSGSSTISTNLTTQITPDALFPSHCTYKQPGSASPLNAVQANEDADCENIAFNFAMGIQNPPPDWSQALSAFPSRYYIAGGSVVNGVIRPPASPFGGVFHSTPVIATPPNALLRDDSYQAYIAKYTTSYTTLNDLPEPRHTVLYVATIDGLLHAFGVDYNGTGGASGTGDPYTFIGTSHANTAGTVGLQNELWTFIPPAVYPKLLNDLGGGENVLLDGAPVVKDTIYQRTNVGTAEDWHTTLVAGFGAGGPGYYALDVTDPDFTRRPSTALLAAHATSNSGTPAYMDTDALPQGPHFLWQLTDPTIFAPTSGIPAITTISMKDPDNSDTVEQIGVAILPGGSASPGSSTVGCARTTPKISDASPESPSTLYPLAPKVRMWTSSGCPTAANPAQGRSLTIVRLDNGEVLRVFAQMTDLPSTFPPYSGQNATTSGTTGSAPHNFPYTGRVTQADFDSPISGTPVPFPSDVGASAQKIYVGDEDGTIWRLTVSDPDPNHWYVEPLFDAYNSVVETEFGAANDDAWAVQRQPISGGLNVSTGRDGNIVLNFGTGDVNYIGQESNQNYVYSVSEIPNATSGTLLANVNWYDRLPTAGEMITGPSEVFDGAYYFATYAPSPPGANACAAGTAWLWGMDFTIAADATGLRPTTPPTVPEYGGVAEMVNSSSGLVQKLAEGSAIIPGVTITSTATCSQAQTVTDPATGAVITQASNVSPATYQISALQGTPGTGTGGVSGEAAAVASVNIATSLHTSALVDSWAAIVE